MSDVFEANPGFHLHFSDLELDFARGIYRLGIETPTDHDSLMDALTEVLTSDRELAERALSLFEEARALMGIKQD